MFLIARRDPGDSRTGTCRDVTCRNLKGPYSTGGSERRTQTAKCSDGESEGYHCWRLLQIIQWSLFIWTFARLDGDFITGRRIFRQSLQVSPELNLHVSDAVIDPALQGVTAVFNHGNARQTCFPF